MQGSQTKVLEARFQHSKPDEDMPKAPVSEEPEQVRRFRRRELHCGILWLNN